jgi:hypothetical protein
LAVHELMWLVTGALVVTNDNLGSLPNTSFHVVVLDIYIYIYSKISAHLPRQTPTRPHGGESAGRECWLWRANHDVRKGDRGVVEGARGHQVIEGARMGSQGCCGGETMNGGVGGAFGTSEPWFGAPHRDKRATPMAHRVCPPRLIPTGACSYKACRQNQAHILKRINRNSIADYSRTSFQ